MEQLRRDPDPHTLHERAANSAKEMRQAMLALSSGALAVFFLALTSDKAVEPALRSTERWLLLASLACMSIAVFAALWSTLADAQWSYLWARRLEGRPDDVEHQEYILQLQDRYYRRKLLGEKVLVWVFACGVLLAAVYLISRIYTVSIKETNTVLQKTPTAGAGALAKPSDGERPDASAPKP